MFKKGDVIKCINNSSSNILKVNKEYVAIEDERKGLVKIEIDNEVISCNPYRFEKVGDNMEKNLLEIIKDGFNNKVYKDVNGNTVYVASNNEVIFNYKKPKNYGKRVDIEVLDLNMVYKLERKQYTFQEAFKAYEEGKEIESCVSYERYSKVDDTDCYYDKFECDWYECINRIDMTELRGEWFINN